MNEGKKYRSLDEVYLQESFAKKLPELPRTRVVFIKENADVVIQKNPPNGQVREFDVSDEVANQIISNIASQQKRSTEEGELSVSEIIDKVLINDGWKAGNKEYTALLDRVIKIFTSSNFIAEKFNNLIKIQKDKNNKFRTALLAAPGEVFAYKSLISDAFMQLFEGEDGYKVAESLWPITFKARVNVGPGELAITLLSDSIKGKTGDLLFDGFGEVEVKGSDARMGGGGYCHNNTPAELNNIISSEQGKLSEKTLLRIKAETYKRIENFIKEREQLKGRVVVPKEKQIEYLSSIKDSLDNADSLTQLLQAVDKSGLPKNIVKSLRTSVEEYTKYKKGEVKGQFAPAFTTFFSMASELTDEQLVRGIVASRSYDSSNIFNDLTAAINSLYLKYKEELIANGTFTRNLTRLVGAMHTAIYHQVQKFRGILFLNDSTKNMLYYEFSNNLEQDIDSLYTLYKKTNAVINLSIDSKFQSAGILLSI
jgi:uncharacterized protein YihD (DUF1040 family)